jgi:hypothetical protein
MGLYQGLGFCRGPCHIAHNMQGYLCGGVVRVVSLVVHLSMGFVFVGGNTEWGSNLTLWLSRGFRLHVSGFGVGGTWLPPQYPPCVEI